MGDIINPSVLWGQTPDSFSLKVDLRDVTVDTVNLTEDKLEVCVDGLGAQGRNRYGFEIEFHSLVDPESSKYRTTDNAVEFSIKKKVNKVWPCLTKSKTKLPWLKIDNENLAFNDDEDEKKHADEQIADELVRQPEENLTEDIVNPSNLKRYYLVLFNSLQFLVYISIASILMYSYVNYRAAATDTDDANFTFGKHSTFELVGYLFMICQTMAILEILHQLFGLVNTGLLEPVLQVLVHGFILFGLILQDVQLQDSPVVWCLLITWSSEGLIRYSFCMLSWCGKNNTKVMWLHYSVWIVLYAVSSFCEVKIVLMSIPLFEKSGMFSVQLPDSSNFMFYFPWFLYFYLFMLIIGEIMRIQHTYMLCKKKLGATSDKKIN